jgi:hypothetical protein
MERENIRIFANEANKTDFGIVGSFQAGSNRGQNPPDTPPDTSQIVETEAYGKGLGYITEQHFQLPTLEEFNSLFYAFTKWLKYLYETGVAEWSEDEEYKAGSIVSVNGVLYMGTNNAMVAPPPTNDTSNASWIRMSVTQDMINTWNATTNEFNSSKDGWNQTSANFDKHAAEDKIHVSAEDKEKWDGAVSGLENLELPDWKNELFLIGTTTIDVRPLDPKWGGNIVEMLNTIVARLNWITHRLHPTQLFWEEMVFMHKVEVQGVPQIYYSRGLRLCWGTLKFRLGQGVPSIDSGDTIFRMENNYVQPADWTASGNLSAYSTSVTVPSQSTSVHFYSSQAGDKVTTIIRLDTQLTATPSPMDCVLTWCYPTLPWD